MNSKERFLNAVRREPVDHVPLYLRLWSLGGKADFIPFNWRDQLARAEALVGMGLDDTLLLEPPLGYVESYTAEEVPGVHTTLTRLEPAAGEEYPRLHKRYHTLAGPLEVEVRLSEDWPHGQDIPLFSDFNVPRFTCAPVQSSADLAALRWLLGQPSAAQLAEFHARAAALRLAAARLGVALDGGWSALGDSAVWLCGMQNVLYWQMDNPALLEELLDLLLEWELRRVDLLLQEGIDELVHMAWYEGTDFWTPRNYRLLLRPRLQHIIDRAHAAGVPFRYIITRGWQPMRRDFLEMGIDCLTGVDPVQDRLELAQVKHDLGGQICLMGGMNAAVTLSQASETEVRRSVADAMRILAPGGGFILYPVDAIFCEQPWQRTQIVIDQWKISQSLYDGPRKKDLPSDLSRSSPLPKREGAGG